MARKYVVSLDLNKNELLNARIQNLGAAPSSPVAGQIYFNTADHTLYFYNGTSWIPTSGATDVIQSVIGSSVIGGTGLTSTYNSGTKLTTIDLDDTSVTAGNYGSQTKIPTFTVDAQGRLTAAGEEDIATSLSINADNGSASVDLLTETLTLTGLDGVVTSANGSEIEISVSSINLGSQTNGDYVESISGTAGQIVVTGSGESAAISIALAEDVEIDGSLTVGGNLTVNGTVTTLNTETVAIEDNVILLNGNVTGTPSADAGIEVERGDLANTSILWKEADKLWELTNDGTNYHSIARKYAETLADSQTTYTVTHNLGTKDVIVQIYEVASPYAQIETDVEHTSNSVATIKFASAPAGGAYRVVITG